MRVARFFRTTLLLVAVLGVGLMLRERLASDLVGAAYVLDGDSLTIGSTQIRLFGIDAPEYAQTCRRAGESWACGIEARTRLAEFARAGTVTCIPRDTDRFGRTVAYCRNVLGDLGEEMVLAGYAINIRTYATQEAEARSRRAGIWAGEFVRPAEWRRPIAQ
jgi:endonuclease YncB( thermonuclease family)